MSLQSVKRFYEKLAQDDSFRHAIHSVQSKDECRQLVKQAGFDFTIAEFVEYTAELASDRDPHPVEDEQLSAVVGGFFSNTSLPPYGHSPNLWANHFQ